MILAILFAREGWASYRFTAGGYVPFASSIQKSPDGELNTYSFLPTLGVGTSVLLEEINGSFSPELGVVFHSSQAGGDYQKSTFYVLGDIEMEWGASWRLRYGLGLFGTLIDGEGGTVTRENGQEYSDFHRPSKRVVSYNVSLNLGWDYNFFSRWFVRLEIFVFSIWDKQARDMGHMLVLGHTPSW